ncbi:hypothetical protein MTR67_028317 [Solanum verrucosum]|uniref:Uncharacterized protein n=1 Tax=Solanum verrucosum TaxID=315347 RepID=A0AAF0R2A5_SOLVR|nr:hypothetical protein MTR67_028317 [Solanum verrucosum]
MMSMKGTFLVSNASITVALDMDGGFIGESIPNAASSSLSSSKSAGLIEIIIDIFYSMYSKRSF